MVLVGGAPVAGDAGVEWIVGMTASASVGPSSTLGGDGREDQAAGMSRCFTGHAAATTGTTAGATACCLPACRGLALYLM
ncbi:hypothetical protein HFRIS_012259 [Herbaspirillum frisingense GSF30]|uniref:Uncharacterized protein n=1 Tax=Herbaspirillum frisingense GSF30 TaxID=864073 RepID=A0AAI9IET6_9BURK|nr:hypothetical protein HFRIS_012259 [Herbaspirillum frisingense GSF30]